MSNYEGYRDENIEKAIQQARDERIKFDAEILHEQEQMQERERQARARHEQAVADELAKLAAQKAAALDAALDPHRLRMQREWVADHPGQTAADFMAHAWPQLKPNLIEDLNREAEEAAYAEFKRSPMAGAGF
jgi:hypothetical protein